MQRQDDQDEALNAAFPIIRESYEHVRGAYSEARAARVGNALLVPPDEIVVELRLLGWAIYEAARVAIDRVLRAYTKLEPEQQESSLTSVQQIGELAHLAESLPWSVFSMRSLGALRSQALAHSKLDTEEGYLDAWTAHDRLDEKLTQRTGEIDSGVWSDSPHFPDLKHVLNEITEQHYLAWTGTACREPEHMLCRWSELIENGDVVDDDQEDVLIRLAQRLQVGITSGERAMRLADDLVGTGKLKPTKDEKHLLGPTVKQLPSIMTARAYLLLLPMCPRLADYGLPPLGDADTWDGFIADLVSGFIDAYRQIEQEHPSPEVSRSLKDSHLRSLVQLRLNFLLLFPDRTLDTLLAPTEVGEECDLNDVDSLAAWLDRRGDDANVIGSVIMPEYLTGIAELRGTAGYLTWRARWLNIDRFAKSEPGRRERVLAALKRAPQ
ncbi:hypothetical protein ACFQNE_11540 [Gordonia phosphorivorans]|uniref:Uncharacterized protein n=1 Tax=Gordonia phosphorivorans TaxID=1056982 RepID=A0ABV6HB18_9ACTN